MSGQKPYLSMLTFLGFQVNSAIEERHGNKISFNDVYKGLKEKNLFELLNEKLPGVLDLSLFLDRNDKSALEQREGLLNALSDAASGMEGREREKYGVEISGLSLLMAYILEAVQKEYWEKSR